PSTSKDCSQANNPSSLGMTEWGMRSKNLARATKSPNRARSFFHPSSPFNRVILSAESGLACESALGVERPAVLRVGERKGTEAADCRWQKAGPSTSKDCSQANNPSSLGMTEWGMRSKNLARATKARTGRGLFFTLLHPLTVSS